MTNRLRQNVLNLILLFVIVGVDQYTKVLAKEFLRFKQPKIYLGGLFRFQYAENIGAFLSMGATFDDDTRFWIFTVFAGLCIAGGLVVLFRSKMPPIANLGLTLLLSGGVGNAIDRITQGRVIDFMNVGIGDLRTGIFNVADMGILLGVVLLSIGTWKKQEKSKEPVQN